MEIKGNGLTLTERQTNKATFIRTLSRLLSACGRLAAATIPSRCRRGSDAAAGLSFPQPLPNVRFHAELDVLVSFSLPRFIGTPTQCSSSSLTGYTRYIAQHTAIRYCFPVPVIWGGASPAGRLVWGPFLQSPFAFSGIMDFSGPLTLLVVVAAAVCHYCLLPWQSAVVVQSAWRLLKGANKK